ncbi:uncharacterized protein LOC111707845 isoform X2 [Eurytemora carolleeae]|uniref:uncharacterized protein LOC111707845 isoform X2 n=1 Tax=Eurytemora carolleeae TaxID=1294199 RepID=UPI000C7623D6|nr:uncharacterized protein LOC111707845 isoform X2 [Eurytemora carolleeae]|eukprot:XP_023336799.1 uncharacterized protein LOC111707845 isoform X2 [Eurytemora affinis]
MFSRLCVLFPLVGWIASEPASVFVIRKLEMKTSNIPGSGMDKQNNILSFLGFGSGGEYSITICNNDRCCRTGMLNTEDNNWEVGQTDWFVGTQIGACNTFKINPNMEVKLQLNHRGSNSGRLDFIRIYSWHSAGAFICNIETRLDYTSTHSTLCQFQRGDQDESAWCNGSQEFCDLRFDQFLFPGTHNSGTGQKKGVFQCSSKNQDLTISQQLDFGIRFFDLDIINSNGLAGCNGLETGHGAVPEIGVYQCFGQVDDLLLEVKKWLDEHTSEVIVLYFGGIAFKEQTVPALVDALKSTFRNETGVSLNKDYKETGEWPTLGSAVEKNARIFTFVRHNSIAGEKGIVEDFKLRPDEYKEKADGSASIISSYTAGQVGKTCEFILPASNETCSRIDADLIKLSLFSRFFKKGVDCLWQMAKVCNARSASAIEVCKNQFSNSLEENDEFRFAPNFLLLDYPNYQGREEFGLVELCRLENMERSNLIRIPTSLN